MNGPAHEEVPSGVPKPMRWFGLSKQNTFTNKLSEKISEMNFLRIFFIIFTIIIIVNIFIFILLPEQYYPIYNVNPLPKDASPSPSYTQNCLSSDEQFILQAPNNALERSLDALYFTTTQFATVGYGDITPKYILSKILCSITHMCIILLSYKFIDHNFGNALKTFVSKKILNK